MIYPVIKFGQDVLRKPATPVGMITDEIRTLVTDMLETMYASHGVGLAAEQVGQTYRICVIDVPHDAEKKECVEQNADVPMPMILINPEILACEGKQRNEEGCLSFPGNQRTHHARQQSDRNVYRSVKARVIRTRSAGYWRARFSTRSTI